MFDNDLDSINIQTSFRNVNTTKTSALVRNIRDIVLVVSLDKQNLTWVMYNSVNTNVQRKVTEHRFETYIPVINLLLFLREGGANAIKLPGISVLDFLPANIAETTVHVIMNKSCPNAETVFQHMLASFEESNSSYAPILLSQYQTQFLDSQSHTTAMKGHYAYYMGPKLTGLERGIERHGFTHLYIITKQRDLEQAIQFQFVYFTMRRVLPEFILFWSNSHLNAINWKVEFRHPVFSKSFMDYRFLITKETKTVSYKLWLICSVCLLKEGTESHDSHLSAIFTGKNKNLSNQFPAWHLAVHGIRMTETKLISIYRKVFNGFGATHRPLAWS